MNDISQANKAIQKFIYEADRQLLRAGIEQGLLGLEKTAWRAYYELVMVWINRPVNQKG